jgi:hypothetical protein
MKLFSHDVPVNRSSTHKQTGAVLPKNRARAADEDSQLARAEMKSSAVVDVHVDLVGNIDCRTVAKTKLTTEHVKQYEHDDDQQYHGKNAASAAAASLDDGRVFAFDVITIVGHETLPV